MIRFTSLKILSPAIVMILAASIAAYAQRRQPVPANEEQHKLIDEGHALYDSQDFDAAIAKYQQVLKLNPDNVDALFDLAASYYDKGDYKRSLEAAKRGSEYESDHLGYFYLMIGTNQDILKQPQKAVEAYRDGLAVEPGNYLLHYNLAVTYLNLKRNDDARESFKRALLNNPNHASSHIGLGQIYFQQGQRIPALMALSRAVALEPQSGRAETSSALIGDLLHPTQFMKVARGERLQEGRFGGVEQSLDADHTYNNQSWSAEVKQVAARMELTLGTLQKIDTAELGNGFAARYYAPYFAELARRGYTLPFVYHIWQVRGGEEVAGWLRDNNRQVQAFLDWTREFQWETR